MFELLKNIFAPKKCFSCWETWKYLCKKCQKKYIYFEPICGVCRESSRNFSTHFYCQKDSVFFDKILISTHYKHFCIKKLLKQAKFYQKKDIWEDVAEILYQTFEKNIFENKEEIVLIATPMYFWKRLIRGYNQSELIIWHLSKKFWFYFNFNIIKKYKSTPAQSTLSKSQRINNLKTCYKLDKKELKKFQNKTFIIVDDVVSTGSTINEIAKILKQAWIQKVYALTFASD